MRAPVPSLRRLFAVGGSPAASHAVLSRAPSSERLLEPMARTRMANDTSLDALARPLDVGALLSRVTATAQAPSIEEVGGEVAARRRVRAKKPVVADDAVAKSVEPAVTRSPAPRRPITKPAVDVAAVRAAVARAFDAPAVARARVASAPDASAHREPRFARRDVTLSPRVSTPMPASISPSAREVARPAEHSAAAQSGAATRVVLESSVTEIERLLAVVETSRSQSATPDVPTRPRVKPAEHTPASNDISRLLASAVDRASTAVASPTPTPTPVAARLTPPSAPDVQQRVTTQVAAPDIEPSVGGFRGLARRTLVANNGSATPVRRVEPERRTPMDLAFDTLDNRVADSLARVLEREARRHGIDLSEARA